MCSADRGNFSVQNNGIMISQTAQTKTEPIALCLGRQVQAIGPSIQQTDFGE